MERLVELVKRLVRVGSKILDWWKDTLVGEHINVRRDKQASLVIGLSG